MLPVTPVGNGGVGSAGGGIFTRGDLTITGGSVSENRAAFYGGGVAVVSSCSVSDCSTRNVPNVQVSGGTIARNTVTNTGGYGGGGGMWSSGALTMTGGEIRDNTGVYGGGLSVQGDASVTGGTLQGNTGLYGGGLFIYRPGATAVTVTLGGSASVTGNQATAGGGGVSVERATLQLTGGSVTDNSAVQTGGGLTVSGTVLMSGGTVARNTVTGSGAGQGAGGGVRMFSAGVMTASGGSISDNRALYGAGVFIGAANATNGNPASDFTLAGAQVTGNTVTDPNGNQGGGFFNDGKLTVTAGTVTGNVATGRGGGVFNTARAAYARAGGTISNNAPDDVFTGQ